jgi:hypothetical protein
LIDCFLCSQLGLAERVKGSSDSDAEPAEPESLLLYQTSTTMCPPESGCILVMRIRSCKLLCAPQSLIADLSI